MSVDAHDLERAALQKKDREQLQSIATAMGRKPPSRARKGEIIDLILELAGSAPASSSGEPGAAPSEGGGGERASGSRRRGTRSQKPSAEAAPAKSEPSLFAADDAPAPAATAPGANGYASASPAGNDPSSSSEAGSGGEPARFVFSLDMPDDQGDAATVELENELLEEVSSRQGARPIRSGGRQRVEPTDAGKGRGRSGSDDSGSTPAGGAEDRSANGAESSNGSTTTGEPGRRDRADGRRDRGEADADGNDHRAGGRDDQGDRKADDRGGRSRGDNRGDGKADGRSDSDQGGGESHRDDSAGRNDTGESNRDDRARDEQRNDRDQRSSGDGGSEGGGRRRRRRGKDRNRDNQNQGDGSSDQEAVEVAGHLDLRDEGYGFLRVRGYLPSKEDVYVPSKFVRQFALRKGDYIAGASRPAGRGEKNPALLRVDAVNGGDPEKSRNRPRFEDLTPLFPDEKLRLELAEDPMNMTARIVDLIAPIGKGQRGLIVSPPKAGKTTVMKQIAQSIEHNNPEVRLIVLLVDERPEEVTDMRRSVRGEVCASTFDRPSDEHTAVAEMTMERAKRMVESGEDVVIILDGITRLARAYNLAAPATGRIMSGGIDTGALYPPKKFFGAARNIEEGGSLTILATALVETGSRMDEVIFEEFKGTGNMELRLDRRLAEKRIYPAFDVDASSTRHEELLFERKQLQMVWKLRRVLSGLAAEGNTAAGLELLIDRMKTFRSNEEFLAEVAKAPSM